MRDEVADGDRQEAGASGRDPHEPCHGKRCRDDDPEEAEEQHRLGRERRHPEAIEPELRLGQAVEQDRADAERDHHDIGHGPAGFQQAAQERPTTDAPVLVREGIGRETTEQPEPHAEDLAVRAPGVASELGHHRERECRVADEDDEQDPGTAGEHQLEPDDDRETDDRRPPTEPRREIRGFPGRHAEPSNERDPEIVERRERVHEVPGRPDERRRHRNAYPAIDPDEQRGHFGVALATDDSLEDDPEPGQQAESAEPEPHRRRHHPAI